MTLRIRTATEADAPALAAFAAETFVATYEAFNTPENMATYLETFSIEQQTAEIADPTGFVLLATDGALMVGYAHIVRSEQAAAPDALEIKRFYVAQSQHGRGVAQQLMDAVVHTATARGTPALCLGVWEKNPRAIAFYTKMGFGRTAETTFTLGNDVQTDLVMVRDLRARRAS